MWIVPSSGEQLLSHSDVLVEFVFKLKLQASYKVKSQKGKYLQEQRPLTNFLELKLIFREEKRIRK